MIELILDNIFIFAVIGYFVISFLGKAGGRGSKQNPSQMPTFGGGGERPDQPRRQTQAQTVSRPEPAGQTPGRYSEDDDDEYEYEYEYESPYAYNTDSEHAEEQSLSSRREETAADLDEAAKVIEERQRRMQRELNAMYADLDDRTSSSQQGPYSSDRGRANRKQKNAQSARSLADQARSGVIWAEILGPPRSKRPFGRKH